MNTNCCQPWQFGAPFQAEVVKRFEFELEREGVGTPVALVVTPVTLSMDPIADNMWPGASAAKSLPLPTV
jgi:hypothetical protein